MRITLDRTSVLNPNPNIKAKIYIDNPFFKVLGLRGGWRVECKVLATETDAYVKFTPSSYKKTECWVILT